MKSKFNSQRFWRLNHEIDEEKKFGLLSVFLKEFDGGDERFFLEFDLNVVRQVVKAGDLAGPPTSAEFDPDDVAVQVIYFRLFAHFGFFRIRVARS